MALTRAAEAGTISTAALMLGAPVMVIGYTLDVLLNVFLFSLIVFSLPREATMTQHMNRLLRSGNSYQKRICKWVCANLLDTFDPSGHHCKNGDNDD